ncbi:F0F1 ATP synthase subunit epsilon [Telmatospirillum sp.]|uniref:F0F1 ATP synthase subunit epsilon n=1 Tax=Telmatospirillum sp. TaxID=2079197 RepID=UPI00284FB1AF|nr:F0F1 ATP synthase subunit epsilon [Telmatospirillum sp.]MDR3441100.1 F0F1 ATP synthase subunit epsilon [Telmatospirillum sp.]
MAEKVEFELVSPERLLVSEPVEMVVVPGSEGDFGALPHHAPMLTSVRPGVIDVYENGKVKNRIFVAGGFAEVTEERVTVLAEEAIPVAEIEAEAVADRIRIAGEKVEEADGDRARNEAQRLLRIAQALKAAYDERPVL